MSIDNEGRLLWVDLEMTGLDLRKDVIMEIAAIATSKDLEPLDQGVAFVIKTPKSLLDNMDPWCIDTHGKTGLTAACLRDDALTMRDAEERMCHFVQKHFADKGRVLLAGSSVHVDKGFLRKDMPKLHAHLHYRICDVSSIKEIANRWYPEKMAAYRQERDSKPQTLDSLHRALADIKNSIDELRWYRQNVFVPPEMSSEKSADS